MNIPDFKDSCKHHVQLASHDGVLYSIETFDTPVSVESTHESDTLLWSGERPADVIVPITFPNWELLEP